MYFSFIGVRKMTYITKKILSYIVDLLQGNPQLNAFIEILCEDGYRLVIVFLKNPIPGLINEYDSANKMGFAYLEGISQNTHYIDLLRNEEPLFANFMPDYTPPQFEIRSSWEDIGEGEITSTLEEIKNRLSP
jgi:hypothetical protein